MKTLQTFLKEAKADYHKPHPDAQIEMSRDKHGFVYYKNFMGNIGFEDDEPRRGLQEGHDLPGWVNSDIDPQKLPYPRETGNPEEYDPEKHEYLGDYRGTAHDEFTNHSTSIFNDKPETQRALAHYTGPGYREINRYLYGRQSYLSEEQKVAMRNLAKGIANHGEVPRDTVVYTGIKYHPWDHPIVNGVVGVHNPAFLSTSISPKTAEFFADSVRAYHPDYSPMNNGNRPLNTLNVLRFTLPKGTHAIYGAPYGDTQHESEFILHPNSKVIINPYPRLLRNQHSAGGTILHFWDAYLMHDGVKDMSEEDQLPLPMELPTSKPWEDIYNARKADRNYIPGQPIQREF